MSTETPLRRESSPLVSAGTDSAALPESPVAPLLDHHLLTPPPTAASELRRFLPRTLQIVATSVPLVIADLAASLGTTALVAAVAHTFFPNYPSIDAQLLTLAAGLLLIYSFCNLYPGAGLNPVFEFRQLIIATTLNFTMLLLVNATFGHIVAFEAYLLTIGWLLSLPAVPLTRIAARSVLGRCSWWGKPVLIVGAGPTGVGLYQTLRKKPGLGFRAVGLVDHGHALWEDDAVHPAYLGPPSELPELAARHQAYWAIVALADRPADEAAQMLAHCRCVPNLIVVPNIMGLPTLWSRAHDYGGVMGIHIQERLLLPVPRLIKRTMDLALVVLGGLLLLPLIGLIALLIKLISPGPAFYAQERIGLNGRLFRVWKFRTMVVNADRILHEYFDEHPGLREEWDRDEKLKNDPRIIKRVGHLLRKFSIDELPQLWNVLRGEMSLVGPRPIVAAEIERARAKYAHLYPLYLRVRPGMTGLWQVSGRSLTTYDERVNLDAYYVRNWSPWLDIYILGRTVRTVLFREGAY